MIILDTHIWIWWVHHDAQLPSKYKSYLDSNEADGFGVSAISCWEIAKLVEYGRLTLSSPVDQWLQHAISDPHVELLSLTPSIAVESTQLPAPIHRDPADQIIIATSRIHDYPLMTLDGRIRNYPHVNTIA